MKPLFSVSQTIVTPISNDPWEPGDDEAHAMLGEGLSLRDAIELTRETRTSAVGGIECIEPSDSNVGAARWITIVNGQEFETGANESRSLHIPESVRPSSRRRIARLVGVRFI